MDKCVVLVLLMYIMYYITLCIAQRYAVSAYSGDRDTVWSNNTLDV